MLTTARLPQNPGGGCNSVSVGGGRGGGGGVVAHSNGPYLPPTHRAAMPPLSAVAAASVVATLQDTHARSGGGVVVRGRGDPADGAEDIRHRTRSRCGRGEVRLASEYAP